jgi:kievitone hydratase
MSPSHLIPSLLLPHSRILTHTHKSNLPTPFNLSAASTDVGAGPSPAGLTSFWSSSFLHASNTHDYLVTSNVAQSPAESYALYRASVLDITTRTYVQFFDVVFANDTIYTADGALNASLNGSYYFGAVGTANKGIVEQLMTWSTVPGVEFDLTFDLASEVLLNGGLGFFQLGGGLGYEFGLPAARTTGSLKVNGSNVTVDSDRSLTWYDRQWGILPPVFTWFEVHLPSTKSSEKGVKMSIWDWTDPVDGNKAFATVRDGEVQKVMAVTSFQPSNRTYYSAATGNTYALNWDVGLVDGTSLHISSITPDQEMHTADGEFASYTGYVTITARVGSCSEVEGFGVVEIIGG